MKLWTEDEDTILRDNWNGKGGRYCAAMLPHRTMYSLYRRVQKLNIQASRKGVSEKYREDSIKQIVAESASMREVFSKLGVRYASSSYRHVTNYIKEYGISTSHFVKLKTQRINNNIEVRLVENSDLPRSSLKRYLYANGIKERICELCGQGEEWRGRKMSLILDHINGVYNDNRLENLRIVCPNCNATLDTHCGKNTPDVVAAREAAKEAARPAKEARKKENYTTMGLARRKVKERPSREELERMIAESNYCAVGRHFGVSDNAIRKWLK